MVLKFITRHLYEGWCPTKVMLFVLLLGVEDCDRTLTSQMLVCKLRNSFELDAQAYFRFLLFRISLIHHTASSKVSISW